jgi:hypothetical protein
MYHKNHPIILIVVPSYLKLNPEKEEKITEVPSPHTCPSD